MQKNVDKHFIEDVARNKEEMLYILAHVRKYFLPPGQFLTNKYIGQILSGKKKLILASQVTSTWVPPSSPYFKMEDIFDSVKKLIPDLEMYMPILAEGQNPPRSYFFQVVTYFLPNFA